MSTALANIANISDDIDPARSVFINCPFDQAFRPLFDAIIFSTVCCGFTPRSALESGKVSEPRISRIVRCIMSSKYSIHDLSRCKGEGDEHLARFNMPLELGIAMARRFLHEEEHDWLVLVPENHQYLKFASDLSGYDPKMHNGTTQSIVPAIIFWLWNKQEAVKELLPTPRQVLQALPKFEAEMELLRDEFLTEVPWREIIKAAIRNVPI